MNKQQNKQETLNRWRDRTDEGAKRQLLAVHVYSQCGARGVRGAVFRDTRLGSELWFGQEQEGILP